MKFQIPRYKGFKVGIFRISPIVFPRLFHMNGNERADLFAIDYFIYVFCYER